MKIKTLVGIASLASSSMLLPLSVNAANPVFDNWTVSNGAITPGACPSGFSCETLTTGNGFVQNQMVNSATGVTYIQTVITDVNASGNPAQLGYRDESFVQLGSTNGILSQQIMTQTDSSGTFTSSSQLANGWANPTPSATNPSMIIQQCFRADCSSAPNSTFDNTFTMMLISDASGNPTDRSLTIDQNVGLGTGTSTDSQRFYLRELQGAFNPSSGSMTLGATSFDSNNNPLNGGTVTWVAGNDVMVRWIGQSINLGAQGLSQFGFEGVVNNTTDSTGLGVTTFSTTSTGITAQGTGYAPPFDWNATFGPAPTLP